MLDQMTSQIPTVGFDNILYIKKAENGTDALTNQNPVFHGERVEERCEAADGRGNIVVHRAVNHERQEAVVAYLFDVIAVVRIMPWSAWMAKETSSPMHRRFILILFFFDVVNFYVCKVNKRFHDDCMEPEAK